MVTELRAHRETLTGGGYDYQHNLDSATVDAIGVALDAGQSMPPVLVAETAPGLRLVLDGHHRIEAQHRRGLPIDAWVIPAAMWAAWYAEQDEERGPLSTRDLIAAREDVTCNGQPWVAAPRVTRGEDD